jgi:hypothetical protein
MHPAPTIADASYDADLSETGARTAMFAGLLKDTRGILVSPVIVWLGQLLQSFWQTTV